MIKYQIGERTEIEVNRQESGFDRASDMALRFALMRFDVDDCGHINAVEGAERSECSIELEFKGYRFGASMSGHLHTYTFEAWVEKHECS